MCYGAHNTSLGGGISLGVVFSGPCLQTTKVSFPDFAVLSGRKEQDCACQHAAHRLCIMLGSAWSQLHCLPVQAVLFIKPFAPLRSKLT